MSQFISEFIKDEQGATAVEYGLIAMLISVAIIAILTNIGLNLAATFTQINTALTH